MSLRTTPPTAPAHARTVAWIEDCLRESESHLTEATVMALVRDHYPTFRQTAGWVRQHPPSWRTLRRWIAAHGLDYSPDKVTGQITYRRYLPYIPPRERPAIQRRLLLDYVAEDPFRYSVSDWVKLYPGLSRHTIYRFRNMRKTNDADS